MTLFLIRHAHAVPAEENPARPLSHKGRAQVARLVEAFRADGRLQPAELWHSPLARSRETAALLATGLKCRAPLVLTPGLEPEDDPRGVLPRLEPFRGDLAIVGHEPHLGLLTRLLSGQTTGYVFHKASVLALDRQASGWEICWQVDGR